MKTRLLAISVPLLALIGVTGRAQNSNLSEHERSIHNQSESNTAYHNNANDYPKGGDNSALAAKIAAGFEGPARPNVSAAERENIRRENEAYAAETARQETSFWHANERMLRGDSSAAMEVAENYYYGRGVKQDRMIAYSMWYERRLGDPAAAFKAARMLYDGDGMEKSEVFGLDQMKAAARLGGKEAIAWLAAHGFPPALTMRDFASADASLDNAFSELAGGASGVKATTALSTLDTAARAGNPHAQYYLARAYDKGLGTAPSPITARYWYSEAVKIGELHSLTRLGLADLLGELGLEVDEAAGFLKLGESARAGDPDANYIVGEAYAFGLHGRPIDRAVAAKFYEAAAIGGVPQAQTRLAEAYFTGTGVPQNADRSALWAQRALDHGQPAGAMILAYLYRAGAGVEQSPEKSLTMMKQAADMGESHARTEIARGFDGVLRLPPATVAGAAAPVTEQSPVVSLKALQFRADDVYQTLYAGNPAYTPQQIATLEKAVAAPRDKRFNPRALAQLGAALLHGDGVGVDRPRALKLLTEVYEPYAKVTLESDALQAAWASLMNYQFYDGDRHTNLNELFRFARYAYEKNRTGQGGYLLAVAMQEVPGASPADTMQYLKDAAAGGITDAMVELAQMAWRGQGMATDDAEGIRYLELAAKSDANAMFLLGFSLANGLHGVAPDRPRALALFRAAAEKNQRNAQHMLAVAYHRGLAVPKDDVIALEWATKASNLGLTREFVLVARLLQSGDGVPHDPAKSFEWMNKAYLAGDQEATAEIQKGFTGR